MTALAILAGLLALGFARYEVPAAVDRYRRKLERERLEREAKALASEQARAALALAIDKRWREFGCARGLTEAESLALPPNGGTAVVPARPWLSAGLTKAEWDSHSPIFDDRE